MIVYRDVVRPRSTAAMLRLLETLAAEGRATDFLVEMGQLEQGAADALHPRRDGWTPLDAGLREASLAAGRAFVARDPDRRDRCLAQALAVLAGAAPRLPPSLLVKPPEGYCHYGLDPAAYAAAAAAYAEAGVERAARALVVGVRSIGTSLSAVVAAAAGSGDSLTLRPRGASGSRRVAAEPEVAQRVSAAASAGRDILLVDEGPGVTGETFACVAGWLEEQGARPDAIVLFPSHDGAMPLAPEERRTWFRAARRFLPPLEDGRCARLAADLGLAPPQDLSAGRWRRRVRGGAGLPVCAGFERLKQLARDDTGRRWQIRFAGLGAWGDAVAERGEALAQAGLGPPPARGGEGFVLLPWLAGTPLRRGGPADAALIAAVGDHVVVRAARFRTGEPVERGTFLAALEENAREAGVDGPGLAGAACRLEELPEREAVVPDGRMRPWEWIRTRRGWTKVDALDHGDTFRLPGPADAAWDLAGAAVELGLGRDVLEALTARCARAAEDGAASLGRAAAAYRPVYAAVAWGEAALSAREAGGGPEQPRLERDAAFYASALRRELAGAGPDRT